MAGAVSAVFSLHSLATGTTSSICSRERVKFNKVSLSYRNVSSGAKAVSIRAQDTYIGQCINTIKITGDDAPAEIWHIIINTNGRIPYEEGQFVEVIHAGSKKRYSIASSARGDFGNKSTVSLCVKRSFHADAKGQIVKGITSNFLCDLKPGENVKLTGAEGENLFVPEDPNANIIMLATDTGIAPFRSFCWKMFFEDDYEFNGEAWLFFGVPTSSSLVYKEEFRKMKQTHPHKFHVKYAVGEGMNIPTEMNQHGNELWELITKDNTFVYMSGNRDMRGGIDEFMTALAGDNGETWAEYREDLVNKRRWNVEVY